MIGPSTSANSRLRPLSPDSISSLGEYAYASFFERSQKILGYTDTMDSWIDIEEKDLSGEGKDQKVSVGTPVKEVVYVAGDEAARSLALVERDLRAACRAEGLVLKSGDPRVEITLKPAEA